MRINWKNKENGAALKEFEKGGKYHPIILQLLFNRGIATEKEIESFFNLDYEQGVSDPFLFADMEKAAERIQKAIDNREKVAVFGDYDADGVTATALIFETLKSLGLENVIVYIPDRQMEGYGMNAEAIDYLRNEGVKLIITVDCGITNGAEVQKAKDLGMDVIITDHHHVSQNLPGALAVINPHLENSGRRFAELAGVGVAFKLSQALYRKMNPSGIEQLKWLLDLVAVGTVADCVPLLGENRVLVKYGLIVLSKSRRAGLLEMFKVGRISIDENNVPDAQKVAFQIAPRINAAGRMDHANVAYNLIIEKNKVAARAMALEIESKNQERQKVTAEIVRETKVIAQNSFKNKKIIFAYSEHWPVGILGLVAGKIAEEFNKPTVVLQKQKKEYVGSLRSIPEVNIIEALEKCSEYLLKFGGHAQAAGVRVAHGQIEKFYEKLAEVIERELEGKEINPSIDVDMEIKTEDINWDLVLQLKKMEPFGEGNEEPVFLLRDMVAEEVKIVGNGSRHLKISLRDGDGTPKIFDSIGFGMGDKFPALKGGAKVDVVFNLRQDEWNGNKKIQLKLVDLMVK